MFQVIGVCQLESSKAKVIALVRPNQTKRQPYSPENHCGDDEWLEEGSVERSLSAEMNNASKCETLDRIEENCGLNFSTVYENTSIMKLFEGKTFPEFTRAVVPCKILVNGKTLTVPSKTLPEITLTILGLNNVSIECNDFSTYMGIYISNFTETEAPPVTSSSKSTTLHFTTPAKQQDTVEEKRNTSTSYSTSYHSFTTLKNVKTDESRSHTKALTSTTNLEITSTKTSISATKLQTTDTATAFTMTKSETTGSELTTIVTEQKSTLTAVEEWKKPTTEYVTAVTKVRSTRTSIVEDATTYSVMLTTAKFTSTIISSLLQQTTSASITSSKPLLLLASTETTAIKLSVATQSSLTSEALLTSSQVAPVMKSTTNKQLTTAYSSEVNSKETSLKTILKTTAAIFSMPSTTMLPEAKTTIALRFQTPTAEIEITKFPLSVYSIASTANTTLSSIYSEEVLTTSAHTVSKSTSESPKTPSTIVVSTKSTLVDCTKSSSTNTESSASVEHKTADITIIATETAALLTSSTTMILGESSEALSTTTYLGESSEASGTTTYLGESSEASGTTTYLGESSEASGTTAYLRESSEALSTTTYLRESSEASGTTTYLGESSEASGTTTYLGESLEASGTTTYLGESSEASGATTYLGESSEASGTTTYLRESSEASITTTLSLEQMTASLSLIKVSSAIIPSALTSKISEKPLSTTVEFSYAEVTTQNDGRKASSVIDISSQVAVTGQPLSSAAETAFTIARGSTLAETSTRPNRLNKLVSYSSHLLSYSFCRCVNSCYESNGKLKLSPQATTHILVECAKCANEIVLKRVFYTLQLTNGTNCGPFEFTSVESRNASISVEEARKKKQNYYLLASGKTINGVETEYVNFTAVIEDHEARISDSYSFRLMVNRPPSGGRCTITPSSVTSLQKATFKSENWYDDDPIISYNIFVKKFINDEVSMLLSTNEPIGNIRVREGEYMVMIRATDVVGDTSDFITCGNVTGTGYPLLYSLKLAITNPEEAVNVFTNPEYKNMIKGTTVDAVLNAINVSDALKNQLKFISTLDDGEILDVVRKVLEGKKFMHVENMTEEGIVNTVNELLKSQNEKRAEDVDTLLTFVSKVSVNSKESFQTVSKMLEDSVSDLSGITLGQNPSKDGTGNHRVVTIDKEEIRLAGEFRCAYKQMPNDTFVIHSDSVGQVKANINCKNNFSAEIDKGFCDIEQMIAGRSVLKFYGNSKVVENSQYLFDERKVAAFNMSFDKFELKQKITDAIFTVFHSVVDAKTFVIFTADNATVEKLKFGIAVPSNRTDITLNYNGNENTVTYEGGLIQFTATDSRSLTFQAFDGNFLNTNGYKQLQNILMDTVYIENISPNLLDNLAPSTRIQLTLTKCDNFDMEIVIKHNDCKLAKIVPNRIEQTEAILMPVRRFSSQEQLEEFVLVGETLYLSGGEIKYGSNATEFISDKSKLIYEGNNAHIVDPSNNIDIYLEETKISAQKNGSSIVLMLFDGFIETPATSHKETVLNLGNESSIIIKNGKIWRTSSKNYVITEAEVTVIGNVPLSYTGLQYQSLLKVESGQKIVSIVDELTSFLKKNGTEFDYNELDTAASSILDIAGDITRTIAIQAQNPLASDKKLLLQEEQSNYDELFLGMNLDGRVRYVDEDTEDEWAERAVALRHREMSKTMVASIQDLMQSFRNAMTTILLKNNSDYVSYLKTGKSVDLSLSAGSAEKLFQDNFYCRDWTVGYLQIVKFPSKLEQLGHPELENENIVVTMTNPYQYLVNYDPLITSGSVDIKLSTINGDNVPVQNALEPIRLRYASRTKIAKSIAKAYTIGFDDYQVLINKLKSLEFKLKVVKEIISSYHFQILDLHAFRVNVWNSSLHIKFKSEQSKHYEGEIWLFVAFQRLPGPLVDDHDWRFLIGNKGTNQFFYNNLLFGLDFTTAF
uniref:Adhesion G-protein coupled receptor G2 n=1 Tax=Syphacia muris TaxID=451379 RepID=A0A0N5AZ62_9BILA